jgi:hypothetical protein
MDQLTELYTYAEYIRCRGWVPMSEISTQRDRARHHWELRQQLIAMEWFDL